MITSKQRSYLRGLANNLEAIFHVGKDGINESFIKQVDEALEVREIIKINVLKNSLFDAKEACQEICEKVGAEPVQVIGNRFIIYRKTQEKSKIQLP